MNECNLNESKLIFECKQLGHSPLKFESSHSASPGEEFQYLKERFFQKCTEKIFINEMREIHGDLSENELLVDKFWNVLLRSVLLVYFL